jgi:hypothetical protein
MVMIRLKIIISYRFNCVASFVDIVKSKNLWRLRKMIKVEISKNARDYIFKTTDTVTVDLITMSGWGSCINEPVASVSKPSVPGSYDEVIVDGIKVYIFKGAVSVPDGIKISRASDWRVPQNLQVEGLLYEQPIAG